MNLLAQYIFTFLGGGQKGVRGGGGRGGWKAIAVSGSPCWKT